MNKGCRLRAKGEKIVFDTEDGKKEYLIKPIKNKELLEVQELWDNSIKMEKAGNKEEANKFVDKANTLFIKYSINRDPKIVEGKENPFTDEEIADMETNFLIDILEKAAQLNGMEKAIAFQQRSQAGRLAPNSQPDSTKTPFQRNLDLLNQNPAKKL